PDEVLGDLPEEYILEDRSAAVVSMPPAVIPYNTEVLGDFEPISWEDLLDPRLRDQIALADPRGSRAWTQLWSVLLNDPDLGEDFVEGVGDQGALLVDSAVPAM